MNKVKNIFSTSSIVLLLLLSSCRSASYTVSSIQGGRVVVDKKYDVNQDAKAEAVLLNYKNKVDSIMSPVIGYSMSNMSAYRPESTLSNLVADILRKSTVPYIGRQADVAVINMGGLRASLNKGEITFGNIFEITPFENTLCIITMTGKEMRHLFQNIASVRGEGLSGAELVITKNGELVSAKIAGKEIDDNMKYKVATVDYLAEGNDKMTAFKEANDKMQPEGATLRQLFLDYVKDMTAKGEKIDSKMEGRIVIK